MKGRRSVSGFIFANVCMWAAMMAVMVVVADQLERWMPLTIARALGWAVASGLWDVALQQAWRRRVGPLALFAIKLPLWGRAATSALWVSDLFRPF